MPYGNVLLVEDETKIRSLLKRILSLEGYAVLEASDLRNASRVLAKETIEVVVCDVMLPDGNGIDFTKEVKSKYRDAEIIILTAHANIEDGVQAMRNGAFDYLTKGNDNDKLMSLISHALEKARLQTKVHELEKQVTLKFGFDSILGNSPQLRETIEIAQKVVSADTTVLLLGETGTGKELFAKAIHVSGKRFAHPFVALNCSAFSKGLLESEIFGYKAGAFTGAIKDKKGLIEEADGGTLFLDEIAEMHIDLQSKLLRVLETNEFIKVGDTKLIKADVRIIAATNRDLKQEIDEGRFREDLFYRLNVFAVHLPALRDRKKDIPLLAEYFMKIFAVKLEKHIEGMSKDFIERLQQHNWSGNVRELKNIIERAVILTNTSQLTIESLPLDIQTTSYKPQTLSEFNLASMEKLHIQRVLNLTKENKPEAARLLNIGLSTLYRKIEEYKLQD